MGRVLIGRDGALRRPPARAFPSPAGRLFQASAGQKTGKRQRGHRSAMSLPKPGRDGALRRPHRRATASGDASSNAQKALPAPPRPFRPRCADGRGHRRAMSLPKPGRDGAPRRPLSGASPSSAGQPPEPLAEKRGSASGDIAAQCPYQNQVGMARRAVRCPAHSPPPPDSRPEPLATGKTAPAGTSPRDCPYQNQVGTDRWAVRLPALSRPQRAGL